MAHVRVFIKLYITSERCITGEIGDHKTIKAPLIIRRDELIKTEWKLAKPPL